MKQKLCYITVKFNRLIASMDFSNGVLVLEYGFLITCARVLCLQQYLHSDSNFLQYSYSKDVYIIPSLLKFLVKCCE